MVSSTSCSMDSTLQSSDASYDAPACVQWCSWCMVLGCPTPTEVWRLPPLACGIPGCSTRHPIRSISGMTMRVVVFWTYPLAGYRPIHAHGLWPCAWYVLLLSP